MSPSEFDLRAALRHGEGESVDADRVIGRATIERRERRERLVRASSIAAVVAVVAGLGVAGGVVLHGGTGASSDSAAGGSGADRSAASTANPAAGAAQATGPKAGSSIPVAAGPLRDAAKIACPPTLPRLSAVGAGSGPMFSGPVEAIKACGYATGSGQPLHSAAAAGAATAVGTIYTGPTATAIAASIEAAPTGRGRRLCPTYRLPSNTLVLIGVAEGGAAMAPISYQVRQNPCNLPITNGTSVRYNWTPPKGLAAFLARLEAPATLVPPASPPRASGSPIR